MCLGICDRVERLCSLSDNFKRIHQIFFIHPDNILSLSSLNFQASFKKPFSVFVTESTIKPILSQN